MSEIATANPSVESTNSIAKPQPQTSASTIAGMRLSEPAQEPKSIWDMAQLRLPQDYAEAHQEVIQAAIPFGKPSSKACFRAHPKWRMRVATIKDEESLYVVAPHLFDVLERDIRIMLLVPYITRDGDIGIWALHQLQATGRSEEWAASAHRVLVASLKGWVRMRWNKRLRSYDRDRLG